MHLTETYILSYNIYKHMDIGDLELTEEELSKVNTIVSGIQSDLDNAIKSLNKGDYDRALSHVNSSISKSNCPLCKRQLGLLIADISHNKAVCILDKEICTSETEDVIKTTINIKNEFVPITTTKKALKDKKNKKSQLELDYEEMSMIAKKEREQSNKRYEEKQKTLTLDEVIYNIFSPIRHMIESKRYGDR